MDETEIKDKILELVADITILWAKKFPEYDYTKTPCINFPAEMYGYAYLFTKLELAKTFHETLTILQVIKNFLEREK